MSVECYPITVLPHLAKLFREYTELRTAPADAAVRRFYASSPFDERWKQGTKPSLQPDRKLLVDTLTEQVVGFGAGESTFANLDKLRDGARAVVTGQQVGLFGGPLLTLLKAATAIRKAQVASAAGVPHVPVFWMATEDHDLDEVNQVALLGKHGIETLRSTFPEHKQQPVGDLKLGPQIEAVVAEAEELLAYAPITELLRATYTPSDTLASAFGKFLTGVFREHGLIVIDASTRAFHAMGSPVLRYAIEHADELHAAVMTRGAELASAGYSSQVLVNDDSSLLFVVDDHGQRMPLRRPKQVSGERAWKAGNRDYTTEELLAILETTPERLSPNALLRPVFQDSILPTSSYIGGPAEIAYFAQCRPVFEAILGEATPVLPRLSATLVPPAIRTVMDRHELSLRDAMVTSDELSQRLAARAMPIEGKRKIAAAGNALDEELKSVEHWMAAMDANLGKSAGVAASKMRYQMNRLRRLAANWQLEREAHLRKHADAITLNLFPKGIVQERLLAGIQLLALSREDLATMLVENAEQDCPGHRVFDI
ncbi:bacillithiol biosynthesis cysteine-adding enzyme BshC [Terriglobus roseus DSM 18391]|uniref:Putative cysteine ligase BshC n=1 Tax=Terriglobus roseus (strain DSM 18391 / NRRL B-41598 / KBS 63) TaxID=926566 RepID=I3ZKJ1_TERRK|nr:bacillithiol biosynthesis cysteine-adding enzyme BshC [Terriglobus roseus]AFL89759.1 bacillithiol biosynthesis cysteine-adding enzyme BshC [Terriglobus roseus DSM 18391]